MTWLAISVRTQSDFIGCGLSGCIEDGEAITVGGQQWADSGGRTAVGGQQWADSSGWTAVDSS
jgi:hypothetical protein